MTAKEYGANLKRMVDEISQGLLERAEAAEARVRELEAANDGLLKRDIGAMLDVMVPHEHAQGLADRVRTLEAALRKVQSLACLYEDDGACKPGCTCHVAIADAALNGTDGGEG